MNNKTKKINKNIIINEFNENKKIVLGFNEKDKKVFNILKNIIIILIGILLLIINNFFDGILLNIVFIDIICIILYLLLILSTLYIKNQKIEIDNSIIIKTNLFNNRRVIGNISEITSFCASITDVIVLKNNKKYFSFQIHGGSDNYDYYSYLKNNYNNSIYIKGTKNIAIIMYLFSIIIITVVLISKLDIILFGLISFLLFLYGLDENIKEFLIFNKQIIYKRLFVKKTFNLVDLTRLEYKKNIGYGRYRPIFTTYTITGYNYVSKCFKIDNVIPENLKIIKDLVKEYDIKIIKK